MLGRRAVVGASLLAFAVTGGGIAVAATRDSSEASKPKVHKVVKQPAATQQLRTHSGHCDHDGTAATSADL